MCSETKETENPFVHAFGQMLLHVNDSENCLTFKICMLCNTIFTIFVLYNTSQWYALTINDWFVFMHSIQVDSNNLNKEQ